MPPVRIISSRKRRRTVTARMRAGVLELLVPAGMPHLERQHWAEVMTRRLERRKETVAAVRRKAGGACAAAQPAPLRRTAAMAVDWFRRHGASVGQLHLHRRRDSHRAASRLAARLGPRPPAGPRAGAPGAQRPWAGVPRAGASLSAHREGQGLPDGARLNGLTAVTG